MCTFEEINANSSIVGTNFIEEKNIKCPSKKKKNKVGRQQWNGFIGALHPINNQDVFSDYS